MSVTDEVKARIDIVDLVSETVQLRRAGKNYTGFCPFHPNTRTPAFVVFPETGTWRCFGQCNEGGDVFRFVMKKEGWDFGEALRTLAEQAGVQLRPPTPQEQAQEEENERLRVLLEAAVTFYRHQLLETQAGAHAKAYLENRNLTDQTIETFGLGYAPRSWDATRNYFISKGYPEADLLATGLVSPREKGGSYDRFRNRVVFPIRDARGRMTGFGARALEPDDMPKYLNSPQTEVFDKSRLLYGLDLARKNIRSDDQAVIVEGYLDVIALHQAGFGNAVSPMGTALTEHQLRQLKRLTRRIILALDADAAGDRATLRGLRIARKTLDRESDPVFDARGLMGYEARLQADIRVTTLPEGLDPDEVVNEDPQSWAEILANAEPIVIHVMNSIAAGRNLDDPKIKTEVAEEILPLIEDVPNQIEREAYRQRLARLLKVDERALLQTRIRQSPRPRARRRTPAGGKTGTYQSTKTPSPAKLLGQTGYRQEAYCLGILLRRPDLIYLVDRALQESGLARLSIQDFQHSGHQMILRLIKESLEQEEAEPVDFVLARLPLDLMDLADEILAVTKDLDSNDQRVFKDLLRALLDVRRRNIGQSIDQLRYLMEAAQQSGDLRAREYQETISQHILTRSLLDRASKQQVERGTGFE
jgi:DNA primase